MSKLQPNNGELVEDKKEVNRYLQSQANAGLEQIQKRKIMDLEARVCQLEGEIDDVNKERLEDHSILTQKCMERYMEWRTERDGRLASETRVKELEKELAEIQLKLNEATSLPSKRKCPVRSKGGQKSSQRAMEVDYEEPNMDVGMSNEGMNSKRQGGGDAISDHRKVANVTIGSRDLSSIVKFQRCEPSKECQTRDSRDALLSLLQDKNLLDIASHHVYMPEFRRPLPASGKFLIFVDKRGNCGAAKDDGTHVTLITPAADSKSLAYFASSVSPEKDIEVRTMASQKSKNVENQLPLLLLMLHAIKQDIPLETVQFPTQSTSLSSAKFFLKEFDKKRTVAAVSRPTAASKYSKYSRTQCACNRRYAVLDGDETDDAPSMVRCNNCSWRFPECFVSFEQITADEYRCSECAPLPPVPSNENLVGIRNTWILDGFLAALVLAKAKSCGFHEMLRTKNDQFSKACLNFLHPSRTVDELKTDFIKARYVDKNGVWDLRKVGDEYSVVLVNAAKASVIVIRCACSAPKEVERSSFELRKPVAGQEWEAAVQTAIIGSAHSRHRCDGEKSLSVRAERAWMLPLQLSDDFGLADVVNMPTQITVDNVVFERHAVSLIDVVDDKDHCSMLIMDGADFIHYDANRPPSEDAADESRELLRRVANINEISGKPSTAYYFRL